MASAKLTPRKKERFLEHLKETGYVVGAAAYAGINKQNAYDYRKRDADFALEWEAAMDAYVQKLEKEADRRAIEGTLRPVFHKGEEVGAIREFSDVLLIFRLKGLKPGMYKERVQVGGDKENPLVVETSEARQKRIDSLIKKRGGPEPLSLVDPE